MSHYCSPLFKFSYFSSLSPKFYNTYRPHVNILDLWCVLYWSQEPQEKGVTSVSFTTWYWFQKLKMNRHSWWMLVGLRRTWRHRFWKVMVASSTCWKKRVCRWILIGFRANLSLCFFWKLGQEIRKGVHIMWPNCCLGKLTQSVMIHSRLSNCKTSGFTAVSVIFWYVAQSQWVVCYRHFGTACWSHFQGLRCPRRMLVAVCDKPDCVALCHPKEISWCLDLRPLCGHIGF